MIDMNEFKEEDDKLRVKANELVDEDILGGSTTLKGIVQYVEKSYFGDSDIFSKEAGFSDSGRDSTAFSVNDRGECSVFVMDLKVLNIIKSNYPEIYEEMRILGLFRYKKHIIKIAKTIKEHYNNNKFEDIQISDTSVDEETDVWDDDLDSDLQYISFDSEIEAANVSRKKKLKM